MTITRNAMRRVAVAGTIAALGVGTVLPAYATPSQPDAGARYGDVYGDIDGDGAADRLHLERAADGVWSVRADTAAGSTSAVRLSDDDRIGDVGLRVTDVNSDGIDEVVAPTTVGANTVTFAMAAGRRGGGLSRVTLPDGAPLAIYEGGGVAAVNGYDCPADHDGRTLDVLAVSLQDGPETRYEGSRTTYVVRGRVADPVYVADIRDARRDDPILAVDPASCAPAG